MMTSDLAVLRNATDGMKHFGAEALYLDAKGDAGGLRIRLEGYFDGNAANAVMPGIVALIAKWDGPPHVIFEADRLEYISSLGIGVLTTARALARQRGFSFELENPSPAVLRVLELLGVTSYMSIQQRREAG